MDPPPRTVSVTITKGDERGISPGRPIGVIGKVQSLARTQFEPVPARSDSILPQDATANAAVISEPPPIRRAALLRFRQTWAYNLQSLCVQPFWWFYLFRLPNHREPCRLLRNTTNRSDE